MWEESGTVMEKKGTPRQSSTVAKGNGSFERKSDSTPGRFSRYNRRRENGNGRGGYQDFSSRKPAPQKNRSAFDKRPRSRGYPDNRQREEIVEGEGVEAGSALYAGSKKGNLNHLLNFTFAARDNVVGSSQRPHARTRRVAFNKERYLQANCQFVVKDTGDYSLQARDPDALVDWDLVEQVRTFSHEQGSCPICLQEPLAGKMTRCGHVYCWACILHYLSLDDKSWRKCPICYEAVHQSDLRSVKVVEKRQYQVGDTITLHLMKRQRGSTAALPLQHWDGDAQGPGPARPRSIADEWNTEYAKVLVASAQQIQTSVIEQEQQALEQHMASAEPSEVCFIESALVYLSERRAALQGKVEAAQEVASVMEKYGAAGGNSNSQGTSSGNGNNGDSRSAKTRSAPESSPAVPIPRNLSFDGSKIRRQYADAFDELEEDEDDDEDETEEATADDAASSLVSGDASDVGEEDENDSLYAMSPPSDNAFIPDPAASHPESFPEANKSGSPPPPPSPPAEGEVCEGVPPELAGEATMTAEEAIQQLAMPGDADTEPSDGQGRRHSANVSKDAFFFYQGADGQHVYLNSLNARCIVSQYGTLEAGPPTITARIIEKEVSFMTENIRKRLRYLSHLPLTCEFQVVEVALQPPAVSHDTLKLFSDEIKRRAKRRQKKVKDDKRQARKHQVEERIKIGIYPEVRLALDSPDQFPAPVHEAGGGGGGQRRRQASLSLSDASLPSPTLSSSLELNVHAAEFVPRPSQDTPNTAAATTNATTDNGPSTFSFAAALKKAKQAPPPPAWGPAASRGADTAAPGHPLGEGRSALRAGSDESDNEDRVPVPVYQASFSDAIQRALDTATKDQGEAASGGKPQGKKKKKEKKLLFTTSMMRR